MLFNVTLTIIAGFIADGVCASNTQFPSSFTHRVTFNYDLQHRSGAVCLVSELLKYISLLPGLGHPNVLCSKMQHRVLKPKIP